jgi:hypothetical protein
MGKVLKTYVILVKKDSAPRRELILRFRERKRKAEIF